MKQNNLYEIKDPEGIVHYDDIAKANLLNSYFTSVFTVDTDIEDAQPWKMVLDQYILPQKIS